MTETLVRIECDVDDDDAPRPRAQQRVRGQSAGRARGRAHSRGGGGEREGGRRALGDAREVPGDVPRANGKEHGVERARCAAHVRRGEDGVQRDAALDAKVLREVRDARRAKEDALARPRREGEGVGGVAQPVLARVAQPVRGHPPQEPADHLFLPRLLFFSHDPKNMNALFASTDLLATVVTHVPFASIAKIPRVCKAAHGALNWPKVIEARIVRFPVGTGYYVARGNGWYKITRILFVVRKNNRSKFVQIGSYRRKIRIGNDGIEYATVDMGDRSKSRSVKANVQFCETMGDLIKKENDYWYSTM